MKRLIIVIVCWALFGFALLLSRAEALPRGQSDASGNTSVRIIEHPAGCPRRAFCGCGLMKYLGLDNKRLWKASEWARIFPPTVAQSGAVAVRAHHVMLLKQHVGGQKWLVVDFNSGGGLSRIHVRDVRSFKFVSVGGSVAQYNVVSKSPDYLSVSN